MPVLSNKKEEYIQFHLVDLLDKIVKENTNDLPINSKIVKNECYI